MNNITPSPFIPPCSDDSTPSPIRPEWVPLQGIAEAITDLRETCQQWVSAYQWLERFANEDRHDEERLSAIRDLFGTISAQQNRVRLLLARLQEEQRRVQRNGALM